MKVKCYNFFFHPFSDYHSNNKKIISVITNIALAVITRGLYIPVFVAIHLAERISKTDTSTQNQRIPAGVLHSRTGVDREALKNKQKNHLAKLQALANRGEWQALQEHTNHPDSSFDWWMFPINRESASFGRQYQLTNEDVEALKRDPAFIQNYRKGVILVAKSWGWDLENRRDLTNNKQHWTNYQVRLGKMVHSLKLFGQNDLLGNLVHFIEQKDLCPGLDKWIQRML